MYENQVTKERQAWFPTEAAVKGGAVDPKRVGNVLIIMPVRFCKYLHKLMVPMASLMAFSLPG